MLTQVLTSKSRDLVKFSSVAESAGTDTKVKSDSPEPVERFVSTSQGAGTGQTEAKKFSYTDMAMPAILEGAPRMLRAQEAGSGLVTDADRKHKNPVIDHEQSDSKQFSGTDMAKPVVIEPERRLYVAGGSGVSGGYFADGAFHNS